MVTRQGPVSLIHDPAARRLLHSAPLAHLACNWRDGTPRVVPIGFRWNGQELVLASAAGSPRTKALAEGARMAVSIEGDADAPEVVLIRGTVRADTVEGVAPEHAAAVRNRIGEEDAKIHLGRAATARPTMTRVFMHPDWAGILDFATRLPSARSSGSRMSSVKHVQFRRLTWR